MKIVLLSPANSIHTVRWANGLASLGHVVHVISQQCKSENEFSDLVTVHTLTNRGAIGYYLMVPFVRKLVRSISPDLLNVHYASGYGTTARLVGFSPTLLSVWGSDIYDFPLISFLHKNLLIKNIVSADAIASTSFCMLKELQKYVEPKHAFITPFGVDEKEFFPSRTFGEVQSDVITIGTVKALEDKYGIDILIKSFALARKVNNNLVLKIYGKGSQKKALEQLVNELDISEFVTFEGSVPHTQVPTILNTFDIYVALSKLDSESFGVAIVEASACGIPVIVSDADGPKEVTLDGITGFVVPKLSISEAASKLIQLSSSAKLRKEMGENGRKHILENYTWKSSLETMIAAYNKTKSL
ncbi:glycosyltransferase [Vibrio fluminensis]|uniref:glycosyltransferase n=1 Tax=Vibrio fluminensis TaxID=2783614 RepID=UPI0018883269|nr:glycosyltransferase [Vibrio fluminensis]